MNKEQFGTWLIYIGTAGLIAAVVMSFTVYSGTDRGAVPAVSFLSIMIGLCFCFPTLLEETPGQVSTMRVVVFSIVMVFVFIYVKIGWNAGTFEEFTIDRTWVYILGIALGSKAIQRFWENDDEKDTAKERKKTPNT